MNASHSRHEGSIRLCGENQRDTEMENGTDGLEETSASHGAFAVPFCPSKGVEDLLEIIGRTWHENESPIGRRKSSGSGTLEELQNRTAHNSNWERYRRQSLKTEEGSSPGHRRGNAFETWLRKAGHSPPKRPSISYGATHEAKSPVYSPSKKSSSEPTAAATRGMQGHWPHSTVSFTPSLPSQHSREPSKMPSSNYYLDETTNGLSPSRTGVNPKNAGVRSPHNTGSPSRNAGYLDKAYALEDGEVGSQVGRNTLIGQSIYTEISRSQTPPSLVLLDNSINNINPLETKRERYISPKSCKYGEWGKYLEAQPASYFRARTSSPNAAGQSPTSFESSQRAGKEEDTDALLLSWDKPSLDQGNAVERVNKKNSEEPLAAPDSRTQTVSSPGDIVQSPLPVEDSISHAEEDRMIPEYPLQAESAFLERGGESSPESLHTPEYLTALTAEETGRNPGDGSASPQEFVERHDEDVKPENGQSALTASSFPSHVAPSFLAPVAEEESEESRSTEEDTDSAGEAEDADLGGIEFKDSNTVKETGRTFSQGRFARLSKVQLRPTKPKEADPSVLMPTSSTAQVNTSPGTGTAEDVRIEQENNRVIRLARLYSMAAKSGSPLQQKFAMAAESVRKKPAHNLNTRIPSQSKTENHITKPS
eukprot:gb/GECG01014531.1/.p1 GENE.gb/GECG01014531.1/~~gb/GECG01014531.1/.p1  ORF type:complete len:651 (+),score=89.94 gb/GECG01014531.1/:1-1953(+)